MMADGDVRECRPVLDAYRELCAPFAGDALEGMTGVHCADIRAAAEMLTHSGPVAYYAWSGVGQHTNATQTDRAISCLYALTGSLGRRDGNVEFAKVPARDVSGRELVTGAQRAKTLGFERRPLGPPKDGWCTSEDLYRAIVTGRPYPVRALLTFGANLLVSHAGTAAARAIAEGDWVEIETPGGRVRARASLKSALAPDVVAAQHGWWQACRELDLPGYPVLGEATANLNAAVGAEHADPISGSLPLRSYLCEVRKRG